MDTSHLFNNFLKIFNRNSKYIFGLLVFLSIDYLGLFFIESILPGIIMDIFNLNALLVFLLLGWLTFSLLSDNVVKISKTWLFFLILVIGILFGLGVWFNLYNLFAWEMVISTSFLVLIGVVFYKKMKN